ncbi:uncharacterized protein LOC141900960 isoform X2 [Tubulanus polymorphus]|uniref:uncharacterized protein LOC141900960 isoform X2 n=1 Tax=Tubulanus polymorphus TaxID=672921 RepID=UPI003DA2B6F3
MMLQRRFALLVISLVLAFIVALIFYTDAFSKLRPSATISADISLKELPAPDSSLSEKQLYELYTRKITDVTYQCKKSIRYGNVGDGGWNVCLDPGLDLASPCLVYSFGINNDWSFDDAVQNKKHCVVHAFDPSMNVGDHKRGTSIFFHNLGVAGYDGKKGSWNVNTVKTIMTKLNHDKTPIDYFKIDVEFSEWDTLKTMATDGSFGKIKQLGIEYHLPDLNVGLFGASSKKSFGHQIGIFMALERYGFKLWYQHTNPTGWFNSKITGRREPCCKEIVYVNTNFMKDAPQVAMSTALKAKKVVAPGDAGLVPPDGALNINQLFQLYTQKITTIQYNCQNSKRFGNSGDGGWDMCLDPAYTIKSPCLIYSFGINWDFSFDDAVDRQFGCELHAFDPSMKSNDFHRGNKINFHNMGISGRDGKLNGWNVKTLKNIMTQYGHFEKVIDYLKIDVEYSEWATFETLLKDGVFVNVRQFGIEYHLPELSTNLAPSTVDTLRQELAILNGLEKLGFKVWRSHANPYGMFASKLSNRQEPCCREVNYVNTKFNSS